MLRRHFVPAPSFVIGRRRCPCQVEQATLDRSKTAFGYASCQCRRCSLGLRSILSRSRWICRHWRQLQGGSNGQERRITAKESNYAIDGLSRVTRGDAKLFQHGLSGACVAVEDHHRPRQGGSDSTAAARMFGQIRVRVESARDCLEQKLLGRCKSGLVG